MMVSILIQSKSQVQRSWIFSAVAIATSFALVSAGAGQNTAEAATSFTSHTHQGHLGLIYISQSDAVYQLAPNYDLNRAKNLARQRGEAENGGVGVYETEPSMHGPATESPHVINADGSVTFTFRGRARGSDFYTLETQVTVVYDARTQWDIVTEYNREISPTPVSMAEVMEN